MVKKAFILLVILMTATLVLALSDLAGATSGLTKLYPPGPVNSGEALQVWKATLTTDTAGNATLQPTQDLYGKLFSIAVMHNETLTGNLTLNVTSEYPYSELIQSYNMTSWANSTVYPRNSTFMYPLAGDLKLNLNNISSTGGDEKNFFAILTLEV